MSTSPTGPTVPEGTEPVAALRQLQEQLASARFHPNGRRSWPREDQIRDESARDAERTAGMNLLPVVNAVEELVADLRRQVAEAEPFALAGEPGWYGSRWVCPVEGCSWDHREPNAVSSVDVAEAERVRGLLIGHLLDFHTGKELASALLERWTEWPAHCSEWIAGADPENPDMCPEYASPGGDKCALHRPDHVEYIADQMRRRGWRSPGMPPDDFNRRVTALREALFGPGDAEHIATAMRGPRPSAETLAESTGLTVPTEVSYPGDVNEELKRELANRIGERLAELDEVTAERGPVQFSGPFGMMTPQERQNMVHGGHPAARPSARVAYPPSPGARWLFGFGPRDAETAWRCQRCMTTQVGNPPACVSCGHTVLDPGHWEADETTSAAEQTDQPE